MIRNCLAKISVPAVLASALWLTASPAWGGHGGGGHGGGYYHGGYHHGGRYGYGYGYPWYGFGLGIYADPWWYNYGCYYPGYVIYVAPDDRYQVFSPPEKPAVATSVVVNVRVPADAQVWFENQQTSVTGTLRRFESPALAPGKEFFYEIRVGWTENGQPVERTRRVPVHAGDRINLDFTTQG